VNIWRETDFRFRKSCSWMCKWVSIRWGYPWS